MWIVYSYNKIIFQNNNQYILTLGNLGKKESDLKYKNLVYFFNANLIFVIKKYSFPYKYVCYAVCLVTQSCPTLCNPMDCSPPGSTVHGDSPGTNIRVGCYALLQGIFPTEVLKPGLLHCRQIFLPSELPGKPINMFNILKNLTFQYSIHIEILYRKYVILLCLPVGFTLALFSELYSLLRVFQRALV